MMKSQTLLVITLLLVAFSTQAYAANFSMESLQQNLAECAHDVYDAGIILYKAYNAIKTENFLSLIALFSEAKILGPKLMADCLPAELF